MHLFGHALVVNLFHAVIEMCTVGQSVVWCMHVCVQVCIRAQQMARIVANGKKSLAPISFADHE